MCIIFICLKDLFHRNLPVYTFRNRCDEDMDVVLGDCTTKIFLNAANCDRIKDEELKTFMEYVKTGRTADDYTEIIDDLVKKARENPTWRREYMDAMMAAVRQQREMREAEEKGMQQGAHDNAVETARRMLADGLKVEQVAKYSGLSLDEVQELTR